MNPSDRVALIREVFEAVFREESFREDDIGVQLAYLFGAIAQGGDTNGIELDPDTDGAVLALFERLFPANHPVWAFIERIGISA
jgi:predicted nucleotidyltransferase